MAENPRLGRLDEVERVDHQSIRPNPLGMLRQSTRDPGAVPDPSQHGDPPRRRLDPDPDAVAVFVQLQREELADPAADHDDMRPAPAKEIDLPGEPVVIDPVIACEWRWGERDHPAQSFFELLWMH